MRCLMDENRLSQATIEKLGYYVYLLIDPRKSGKNNGVFYVGKGNKKRAPSHLKDTDFEKEEYAKNERINEIRRSIGNPEPKIDILRHGLTSDEAFKVESAVIDYIGIENLTNEVLGHDSTDRGRMSLDEVEIKYQAKKAEFLDDLLLININKTFRRGMSSAEILKVTKGDWRIIKERANNFKIVCAVFRGIVREVFEVEEWAISPKDYKKPRIFFEGKVANKSLREKYLYRDVSDFQSQIPTRYIKFDKQKKVIDMKCLCGDSQCAKCLTVNCEDDNCTVHTMENKTKRRNYFEIKRKDSTKR